jgi:Flp pilus assembly protein TadB
MFKFLPGILLVQLVTGGLLFAAIKKSEEPQLVSVIFALSLLVAILAAFWFASIAREMHKTEQSKMQEQHARDREQILVNAEREKADIAKDSYQKIAKETKKTHAKANFKVGFAFAAAAGAGGLMIFTQLVTVGMMVLIASGSGLAGYLARARQERIAKSRQIAVNEARLINSENSTPKRLN